FVTNIVTKIVPVKKFDRGAVFKVSFIGKGRDRSLHEFLFISTSPVFFLPLDEVPLTDVFLIFTTIIVFLKSTTPISK
ncbi:MAG: hypothetical protein ACE1ZS_08470, partial [Candidatus Poribacteria bacterium]